MNVWRAAGLPVVLCLIVLAAGCTPKQPVAPVETPPQLEADEPVDSAEAASAKPFEGDIAWGHADALTALGPRPVGSDALGEAIEYVDGVLTQMGYEVERVEYELPDGTKSVNVTTVAGGGSTLELVLAACLDTAPGSQGANIGAAPTGVLLELAAALKEAPGAWTVRFLFLTAEQPFEGHEDRGYSGLKYVEGLGEDGTAKVAGAMHLAAAAAGETVTTTCVSSSDDRLATTFHAFVRPSGVAPTPTIAIMPRWAEKMAFEDAGIPMAWIAYNPAPNLGEPGDTMANLDREKLKSMGMLLRAWVCEEKF